MRNSGRPPSSGFVPIAHTSEPERRDGVTTRTGSTRPPASRRVPSCEPDATTRRSHAGLIGRRLADSEPRARLSRLPPAPLGRLRACLSVAPPSWPPPARWRRRRRRRSPQTPSLRRRTCLPSARSRCARGTAVAGMVTLKGGGAMGDGDVCRGNPQTRRCGASSRVPGAGWTLRALWQSQEAIQYYRYST